LKELFEELSKQFSLIPLNGKIPINKGWEQWCSKKRSFNPDDFKGKNAGIACGPASGIIVIDVDHLIKFNKMVAKNGWSLPQTRMHLTGSGLPHYLYAYPNNGKLYGNKSFNDPAGEIDPKNGKVIKIFDIKALGGQVVCPGSIHPDTGKAYTVRHDICLLYTSPSPRD